MKRIKILPRSKPTFLTKLLDNDVFIKPIIFFCFVAALAALVWFCGPFIAWNDYLPLAQPEKRGYVILAIFLLWLLKFLLLDLDSIQPFQDSQVRKKCQPLLNQFRGAILFLKKTKINKHGKDVYLNHLPWYLFLGQHNAGKTSLLANANVNFILQRQFQNQDTKNLTASEHCNWWLTRDACIVDVPGKYLSSLDAAKQTTQKATAHALLWRYFLRLVRKQRGKQGIDGIIIALPLPEIIAQGDTKKYHGLLRQLFQRLYELQKLFPQPLPCHLLITKCDLIKGFSEFFSDFGQDETTQAWGVVLPKTNAREKTVEMFSEQFDALIKRLNQQLITRLHQERNPLARPAIKDFPLQIEQLKEYTAEFIKKLSATPLRIALQGVYLTSALQSSPTTDLAVIDESLHSMNRAAQLFKEPANTSRPYFIKQFITHGLTYIQPGTRIAQNKYRWKRRAAYAASIASISVAALILGRDFEQGIEKAYAIQNYLSEYRLAIQNIIDPDQHLIKTLDMLDDLQQATVHHGLNIDLSHLLSFYSNKSQVKAALVYQQALQTILIPEIKSYFEGYLKTPSNKNADDLYAALKSYLMFNDATHAEPTFIINTMRLILSKSMTVTDAKRCEHHLQLAMQAGWQALLLDDNIIKSARTFLTATPTAQLGYIILKNLNNNTLQSEVDLGINAKNNGIFVSRQLTTAIPSMFTAKRFSTILSQEIATAAEEATVGNWVLGNNLVPDTQPEVITALIEQLRVAYINNYVDVWENILSNIHVTTPKNLTQADNLIVNLLSRPSPLVQLLQTLHSNTYFEPLTTASPKLLVMNSLIDTSHQTDQNFNQIFAGLQMVHQYLRLVITANNPKKAAYDMLVMRMQHQDNPDAITQLRLIAEKTSEPVKTWLNQIANDAWHLMMQEAGSYINTAWQNQIIQPYQSNIAHHYPFATNASEEVDLAHFTTFFGNPGLLMSFYEQYLEAFVDHSTNDWRWKALDDQKLPFSDDALRQIQLATRIHHTFFPNGDNKLYVQFALEPYKFAGKVKKVQLTINDKQVVDDKDNPHAAHVITWPNNSDVSMTSVKLTLANQSTVSHDFPGAWGWFKLVNRSLENVTPKQMLLNFSENDNTVKYVLFTEKQVNPFSSINLSHFNLPAQLVLQRA